MTIRGLNIKLGADASSYNKSIQEVRKNTRDLNSELTGINRSLKFDTKNPELLAQKTKVLSERFNETSKKLDLLKSSQDKVNQAFAEGKIDESQYRKHQTEIAKTESQLKGYEEQLRKAQKEMLRYDGQLGKITASLEDNGQKMDDMGKKLAPYSALTAGALIGLAKSAVDFDTAWIGVQKTMSDDITPEQLNQIKDGIKDMSKEIGVGTTEVAGVAEAAGQLGIETDNILSFTRVMIDMGKATNLSSDVAATTLARFANVTKMSQKDFSRLGSTIVALGNNSATTEAEIASMAMNLGAAGSQIGMSESDIIALAASLSSVGLEAAGGGTAFSKLMVNMKLAAETGSADLKEFANVAGLSAKEFAKKFGEDATGAMQLFMEGLSNTERNGKSAIAVLDDMGIKETRLRDALLRTSNASDIFNESIKLGSQAWSENNALSTEAEQRYNSVQGKMDKAKESFNVMSINLGDKLLPHLTSFFEKASKVVDAFGKLDDGTQKFIVTTLGVTAVAAPLLIVGGKAVKGLGAITGALGTTGKALGLIKTSSVVASTAVGGVGTASATAAAGTGLLSGAGTAVAGAIGAISAPAWLAVGALAAAGVGAVALNNELKKEVIPTVDLFADGLSFTNVALDEHAHRYEATVVKISKDTKVAVGAHMEMSDGILDSYNRMYYGVNEITDAGVQTLQAKTSEMVKGILEKNTERKDSELAIIGELFASNTEMTDEQKTSINEIIASDYSDRETKTIALRDELNKLYSEMTANAEGGTLEQKNRVEEILKQLNESAISVMSKDEAERNVILNRMKDYGERLTAEQASNIIQELEEQKLSSISIAGETRDEQVRIAEDLKLRGGKEAQETAQKIIDEANRQYKETVELAEKGKTDAVDKLIQSNKDLSTSIDLESGKIKTKWDNVKSWWDNLWFAPKTATVNMQSNGGYYNSSGGSGSSKTGYGPNYNNGLKNVPYNGFQAILHRDEAVLTAYENRKYQRDGFLGNPQLSRANKSISNINNNSNTNNISIGGNFYVREENDIKKIAKELQKLTNQKARA